MDPDTHIDSLEKAEDNVLEGTSHWSCKIATTGQAKHVHKHGGWKYGGGGGCGVGGGVGGSVVCHLTPPPAAAAAAPPLLACVLLHSLLALWLFHPPYFHPP